MMTKLEQLEKKVVDTKDAYEAAFDAANAAWGADAAWDAAEDAEDAAADAWVKAKLELAEYLKEQDEWV